MRIMLRLLAATAVSPLHHETSKVTGAVLTQSGEEQTGRRLAP